MKKSYDNKKVSVLLNNGQYRKVKIAKNLHWHLMYDFYRLCINEELRNWY